MSTKAVRLDEDVMDTLAKNREGFETPNECLKRLLDGHKPCNFKKEDGSEEPKEDDS